MNDRVVSPENMGPDYLGIVRVPIVAFRNDRVNFKGPITQIFHKGIYDPENPNRWTVPSITENVSVFDFVVVGLRGQTVRTMRVRVKKLTKYEYNEDTKEVAIAFDYEKLYDIDDADMIEEIKPVISHIVSLLGRFLILIMEGAEDVCEKEHSRYRIIKHGDKFYYRYKITALSKCIGYDSAGYQKYVHYATIFWMYDTDIEPPYDDMIEVNNAVIKYLAGVYPIGDPPASINYLKEGQL